MLKSKALLVLSAVLFSSLTAGAQRALDLDQDTKDEIERLETSSDELFSPSVGQIFYEIAYELANSEDINAAQAKQAIIFLDATLSLDSRANYVRPVLIKLAYKYPDQDHSKLVYDSLVNYLDESADLEPIREAVRYLLERLNSREQREQFLQEMLQNLGGKNDALDSELATLLGLLMAEKADFEAAQLHLMYAIDKNKYNKLAFAKLAELAPEQIPPVMYLEHLRLALGENPTNLDTAMAFAQFAEQLQLYQTAADAYQYCAELFRYLYPSEDFPAQIYLPWMISSYNTQRNQHRCLQIADQVRQSGRFNLLSEAIAGKAAAKIGDTEQAVQILQTAEDKARQLVDYESQTTNYQQLAWFYCFALSDEDNAIEWANKAYSVEPNSATAAAILAYSLVMNSQFDWAKFFIDNYEHNQIAELALAQIQFAQGQKDAAIDTLKSAITKDPGSLEAERAKEILAQYGTEYIPPIDADITLAALRNSFGQTLVPAFVGPEKAISVQLNTRGSKFSYGSNFSASIVITNNSSEQLVISDDGLLNGDIRIDANITGDLNKQIPNLVSLKIRPALPVKPGRSIVIPVRLVTAELRTILLTSPQASVDIEFTLYLDPVTTEQGVSNKLTDIEPFQLVIKRQGVNLTAKYLRNRFSSLTRGRQGQKIKTAQLFTGLLAEQNAMANTEPLYKFMYADWMPAMLKSTLLHNLTDDDWVAKAHTIAGMLCLPLDYELTEALAENLNEAHWPVRMMALYLLAKKQGSNFNKVLNWTAKYDSSIFVRNMAIASGAAKPQEEVQEPTYQPSRDDSEN
ncbi:MAG: CDC27 family protein [Planctomycetota bacterium]|nr:MAG: CDC27 family protein [Planctomycetota bacterium]